ncbi:hypothetical protein [Caballeronia sp. LjRoot31]|jgi:hypothetical protein|uniref:hypothetical protein n=1 Tax=Caballeronia sp. LjRoot31 TaxID=3342324 RepID=UPI003ECD88EE
MSNDVSAVFDALPDTDALRAPTADQVAFAKARFYCTAVMRPEIADVFPEHRSIAGKYVRVVADNVAFNVRFGVWEVIFRVYRNMDDDSFVSHFFARALTNLCL